uniref:uncharacterized protein LOC120333907 n=1 Tax=Styela clava TaxID=7725 RepID=UPI00193A3AFC|nr:uncharacterized protein LOC120333907 [Styela clava]
MTKRNATQAADSAEEKKSKQAALVQTESQTQISKPELYTSIPKQPIKKKPGQLTKKQLEEFFDRGFLVLEDFIDHKILDNIRNDIEKQVDDLAEKLFNAGRIKNKHEDKGLLNRLTHLEKEYPGIAVLLHKSDYVSPDFQKLWSYDKLLNVVEQIIGPEISGHPVWNLRPKVPNNEQLTVPWHQDNAYFEPSAIGTFLATAWIPFVDAKKENGCLQMIPKGHHKGMTATHTCCAGGTWYVDLSPEDMKRELNLDAKDAVTCEIPYGGVLLFSNCIPHRSLENLTNSIRWSVDLRWQRTGDPVSSFGNCVVMRTADNPDLKIDWSPLTDVKEGRNKKQDLALGNDYDEFEPVISGPWMTRWKIVHHNKHTAQHQSSEVNDPEHKP